MRAGNLDRTIFLHSPDMYTVDAAGTPETEGQYPFYGTQVRAQLIEASTEEYQRAYGDGGNMAVIFRTRWLDGVTTAHSVTYADKTFNIRDIKEIGRRKGLELRCEEVRE